MKRQKKLCEINGKRYMAPSAAVDLWDMSYQAVTRACKDNRIVGACKDSSNHWIIPVEALKPMDLEDIRKILVGTLILKNRNLELRVDSSDDVIKVYDYMTNIGMFEPIADFASKNIKDLVLTDKGMKIATEGKKTNISWLKAAETIVQVVASIITIWQSVPII